MAVYVQTNPKKTVVYKTITEFCPSNPNLEEETLDLAKKLGGEFTVDDMHVLDTSVEKMKKTTNIYGSVIHALLEAKRIVCIGYVPSSRRESHHRRIGKYRVVS